MTTTATTTATTHRATRSDLGQALDLLCQHEFDDHSVCAATAMLGSTRCAGHLDDGQPAVEVTEPSALVAPAAKAGAR